jgi:hypothetical protein
MIEDRAIVVTRTIKRVLGDAIVARQRGDRTAIAAASKYTENLLRDEFADCAREAREEYAIHDD